MLVRRKQHGNFKNLEHLSSLAMLVRLCRYGQMTKFCSEVNQKASDQCLETLNMKIKGCINVG